MTSAITLAEVKRRVKGLDTEKAKGVVCALVGHSLISTTCMGYRYCARCGEQVGDSLGSIDPNREKCVVVGHNCTTCRANFKKLDWRHTFLSPEPFPKKRAVKRTSAHPEARK